MRLLSWEKFNENKNENKNHAILLKTGERFWIGSANVYDGEIEEVHTYEKAKDNDFHHSFYFSEGQLEKIKDEECMIFWVDSDGFHGEWTHGKIPTNIISEIQKQIKFI